MAPKGKKITFYTGTGDGKVTDTMRDRKSIKDWNKSRVYRESKEVAQSYC